MAMEQNCVQATQKDVENIARSELYEYQQLKRQVDTAEKTLEELCTAIEEFGLACTVPQQEDARKIYCTSGVYTPSALLAKAKEEAARLEEMTTQASEARGRVLTKLLQQSKNISEYRVARWRYVDSVDCKQGGVLFPEVSGLVS